MLALIRLYRSLTPFLGQLPFLIQPQCRFQPTCSEYASLAIEKHGPYKGMLRAGSRLMRCHPAHAGGIDLP